MTGHEVELEKSGCARALTGRKEASLDILEYVHYCR